MSSSFGISDLGSGCRKRKCIEAVGGGVALIRSSWWRREATPNARGFGTGRHAKTVSPSSGKDYKCMAKMRSVGWKAKARCL